MFGTVAIYLVAAVFITPEFMRTGQREKFPTQDGIYKYYCGKVVGSFYDVFAHIFVYSSFVVMVSASGATLHQHFGVPVTLGAWLTAGLAALVAVIGFFRIASLLSKFGGILIIMMLAVCTFSIVTSDTSFTEGTKIMASSDVLAASESWFTSGINYLGFALFWAAPFVAKYSQTLTNPRVAVAGQALGEITLAVVTMVISIALIMNVQLIADSQVPILALASHINGAFGGVYAVLMCLAIFSTAVPLLSLSTSRLVPENSPRSPIALLAAASLGALCASLLPFDELMNYIYVINGYVGFVFVFFVIAKVIRRSVATRTRRRESYAG
ncbi:hypothetical protein [Brevibacterium aurantiacum]|uniref:YkvI family membrane protein n=1 Tax=Brevibacterium aurantiacum TaxID=273384 RepID=UPI00164259C7|nr:hypothetical protein [Brevibacterium aurantiacum]